MERSRTAQTALYRAGSSLFAHPEVPGSRTLSKRVQCAAAVSRVGMPTIRRLATLNGSSTPSHSASPYRAPSHTLPWPPPSTCLTDHRRGLSTSATLGKKKNAAPEKKVGGGNKAAGAQTRGGGGGSSGAAEDDASGSTTKADPENAYDMRDVEEAYTRLAERTDEKLRTMRQGGRFNPDSIGRVPVELTKGSAPVPLSEAALVDVQQGRVVQLTLFEPGYKKAVMSAIQHSPQFNQQPQPDPEDDSILTLKVEPERLDDQLRAVKETCHALRESLRRVTAARQKKHTQWGRDKLVTQDDIKQLNKAVQKLQDARMKKVDSTEAAAVQALKKAHGSAF